MAPPQKQTGTLQVDEGKIAYTYHPSSATSSSSSAKPALVFLHAAVADQTLWNEQITYLNARGWDCLSYDLLGFGRSTVSEDIVSRHRDAKHASEGGQGEGEGVEVDHLQHLKLLIEDVLLPELRGRKVQSQHAATTEPAEKVIVIGLSIGGGLALEFAINQPHLIAGLVVVAGGIREFNSPNTAEEDALFAQEPVLLERKDVEGLAGLMVRIWGDGPLQSSGRLERVNAEAHEKMVLWNREICKGEVDGRGGFVFGIKTPPLFPPMEYLDKLKMPVAVGWGVYDESNCTAAMKALTEGVEDAEGAEFETAHMVNLEKGEEVSRWLGGWLEEHFEGRR